ncbi:hypothetical protein [Methylobacterium aquaticum]|uniref:Uncharacterized protein n=1 Tax=Methylobacterium aquaticum TaxID=270351 RepID=A0A0J6SKY8_9HYPH|nr:hypothetical protein [Methylobacterium aquaticum]KMO34282.1 hypothetical protein VP06_14505 [Methylobacterium aquaticum]
MAAVTKHDETAIGLLLAGSHLARLDPIDCQNLIAEHGIRPADLKEGFSWLQARIEAFNVRSGWVWAERSAKAHRIAMQAAALTMVSTPLAAAEAVGCGPTMSERIVGVVVIWTVIVLTMVVLSAVVFRTGSRS